MQVSIETYKKKLTRDLRTAPGAPHKICMLLAVFDLVRSGYLKINRIEYSQPLLESYRQYFDAVRTDFNHPNPYFPFYYLSGTLKTKEKSFWRVVPLPGKSPKEPRGNKDITENLSHVELENDLFSLIQDPVSLEVLTDALVRYWFDRGYEDLLAVASQAKLVSNYEHRLRDLNAPKASEPEPPEYIRNPAFRRVVLDTYDYRCAATGLRVLVNDTAMVEAAHIHPFSESGDDDPRNGLALTPNMHWAMDSQLIAPGPDFKWHVSKQLDSRIPDFIFLIELDGKDIFLPRERRLYPKQEALDWRLSRLM
jgi:putative restriction endonuclease